MSPCLLIYRTTRRTLVLFSAIVAVACWLNRIPVKISQLGVEVPLEEKQVVCGATAILFYLAIAFVRASWSEARVYFGDWAKYRENVAKAKYRLVARLYTRGVLTEKMREKAAERRH